MSSPGLPDPPAYRIATSTVHGRGAFATRDLPAGMRVAEYGGERISKAESLQRCIAGNHFIFTLDDEVDLDGSVAANDARFFNHSCDPNCEAVIERGRIWLQTIRPVADGGELSFNYGYDLTDYRDYPCRCNSSACVGYMVAAEFHDQVRRAEALRKEARA